MLTGAEGTAADGELTEAGKGDHSSGFSTVVSSFIRLDSPSK